MKTTPFQCARALTLLTLATASSASYLSIDEASLFVYNDALGSPLQDRHFYSSMSNLSDGGLSVSVDDRLNANRLGQFEWSVTNQSGKALTDLAATVFLDASFQTWGNYHYDENVSFLGNTTADQWEADEPGFVYGDIYGNAQYGELDNTNTVTPGREDDPSMALGFYLPTFDLGDTFTLTLETSDEDIGGFYQYDPALDSGVYMNAWVEHIPASVPVPEPSTWVLLGAGLVGLGGARWLRRRSN